MIQQTQPPDDLENKTVKQLLDGLGQTGGMTLIGHKSGNKLAICFIASAEDPMVMLCLKAKLIALMESVNSAIDKAVGEQQELSE